MTITVNVDDKLIQHALEFSGQMDMNVMISEALREYVGDLTRRENCLEPVERTEAARKYVDKLARQRLIDSFGTFDIDPDYDPKAHR